MLEIIALIFLTREIGRLAAKKGLRSSTWKIYLVAGWILSEIIGFVVGLAFFGLNNLFSVMMVGFAFAFGSYFFLHNKLEKYPDYDVEDEFEHFGEQ